MKIWVELRVGEWKLVTMMKMIVNGYGAIFLDLCVLKFSFVSNYNFLTN